VIGEEIARIAEAAANDYERARASEESLARSLDALKRSAIETNDARVGLRELERDVQTNRAIYEAFLKRARETGEQERLDARNVRVISQADVPLRRSWPPSYALIALGALMFGVSAGTGIALLRGIAGHRDRPPQPAPLPAPPAPLPQPAADAPTSDHPLLAELPNVGAGHPLSVFEDPKSRPAAEVRKLHDTLRAGRKRWSGQSILLVAPHDGSETTTVAVNLGLVAAASQSVLLIDTDIRGQALAAILPNQNRGGLIEVASGQKLLSEAIVHDPRTNISMLPLCGEKLEAQGDIKDDDIKAAFDQTKRFDLVIVAGTLAYDNPAAGFFAALVDQIVLITSKGGTQKGDLDAVISTLGSSAHKIRGTVLTNAKA